jgi:hypothetical protein
MAWHFSGRLVFVTQYDRRTVLVSTAGVASSVVELCVGRCVELRLLSNSVVLVGMPHSSPAWQAGVWLLAMYRCVLRLQVSTL